MTHAPSTLLGGRYALVERLAVGGMGEIWAADDNVLGRAVAVKILRDEYVGDEAFRQRFRAEAQHAALLVHPHVAQVFDFGEGDGNDQGQGGQGDDPPWLVMELVRGEPLSALIANDAPLPPDDVWRVLGQASSALAAAHDAGVVHRDVKPANMLVCPDGTLKVTDFGIARAAGVASVTATGFMLGTPHYLSPEQVSGQSATAASDFYALGVVAYECLTGRRPFEGEAMAVCIAHRDRPVPPLPSSVPPALRDLVTALLEKDPARRPTDGRAIAAQADRMTATDGAGTLSSTIAYPAEPAAPSVPPAALGPSTSVLEAAPKAEHHHSRGWVVAAIAAGACFLVATAIVLTQLGGGHKPSTATAAKPPHTSAAPTAIKVASVQAYAGSSGSSDHPEEAPLAVDGNPSTAWYTQHYASANFGGLRSGTGLVFDLGSSVAVRRLVLQFPIDGTSVVVRAADSEGSLASARQVGSDSSAPTTWTLQPGVTARYWLVWFTRLAPSDGAFRAGIAEASFAR